jgi:hypothetical protein
MGLAGRQETTEAVHKTARDEDRLLTKPLSRTGGKQWNFMAFMM